MILIGFQQRIQYRERAWRIKQERKVISEEKDISGSILEAITKIDRSKSVQVFKTRDLYDLFSIQDRKVTLKKQIKRRT